MLACISLDAKLVNQRYVIFIDTSKLPSQKGLNNLYAHCMCSIPIFA